MPGLGGRGQLVALRRIGQQFDRRGDQLAVRVDLPDRPGLGERPDDLAEIRHARAVQHRLAEHRRLDRRLPALVRRQALAREDQVRQLRELAQLARRVAHGDIDFTGRGTRRAQMKGQPGFLQQRAQFLTPLGMPRHEQQRNLQAASARRLQCAQQSRFLPRPRGRAKQHESAAQPQVAAELILLRPR